MGWGKGLYSPLEAFGPVGGYSALKVLPTLLGAKPLLEAFGPVGVNPPKGSGRAVRGI